jgi:hypothetical protein
MLRLLFFVGMDAILPDVTIAFPAKARPGIRWGVGRRGKGHL